MKLVIIGAGGYGQTVADVAEQLGKEVIFLDDNSPLAVGKTDEYLKYIEYDMLPAFGNNELRLDWCNKIIAAGGRLPVIIHPKAYVSPKSKISDGVVVLPNAVVNTNTVISRGCIINVGTIVDHGTVLSEGVHVAPGAIVKAENLIPRLMKVESGTVIENRQYPLTEVTKNV